MNDKCSNGFCKFDSYTTTKIINMNRNQLKQMWFNLPTQTIVTKTILVEMDKYEGRKGQGTIQITSDGPNGYSSFKTHQEFPMKYALNTKEYKSGEYSLVIK